MATYNTMRRTRIELGHRRAVPRWLRLALAAATSVCLLGVVGVVVVWRLVERRAAHIDPPIVVTIGEKRFAATKVMTGTGLYRIEIVDVHAGRTVARSARDASGYSRHFLAADENGRFWHYSGDIGLFMFACEDGVWGERPAVPFNRDVPESVIRRIERRAGGEVTTTGSAQACGENGRSHRADRPISELASQTVPSPRASPC